MKGRPHLTKMYARYRVREPGSFIHSSFRTQPIGHHGSKRIAGKLKASGNWATQAILLSRHEYGRGKRVKILKNKRTIVYKKKR